MALFINEVLNKSDDMIKINVTDVDRIPDGDAKKDGFQKNLTHFVSNPGFTLQINFINKEWYYLPPTFMK